MKLFLVAIEMIIKNFVLTLYIPVKSIKDIVINTGNYNHLFYGREVFFSLFFLNTGFHKKGK